MKELFTVYNLFIVQTEELEAQDGKGLLQGHSQQGGQDNLHQLHTQKLKYVMTEKKENSDTPLRAHMAQHSATGTV